MLKITYAFYVKNESFGSFNGNEGLKELCKKIADLINDIEFEDWTQFFEFDGCKYILHIGDDTPTTVLTNHGGKETPAINIHRGFAEMRPIVQAFILAHEIGHYKMGHLERMTHPIWAIINLSAQIIGVDLQEFDGGFVRHQIHEDHPQTISRCNARYGNTFTAFIYRRYYLCGGRKEL